MAAVIESFPSNFEDWVGHISRSGKIDLSVFQKDMKADWFQALVKEASPGQALDTFSSMFEFNILPKEHHTEAFIALIQAPFFPGLVNSRPNDANHVRRFLLAKIPSLPEANRLDALTAVLESKWFDSDFVKNDRSGAIFVIQTLTVNHPEKKEFYTQHHIVEIAGQDSEGIVIADYDQYSGIIIVRRNKVFFRMGDGRTGEIQNIIHYADEYLSGDSGKVAREEITRKLGSLAATFQAVRDSRANLCQRVVDQMNALNSGSVPSPACAR